MHQLSSIKHMKSKDELVKAFNLLNQLRTHLTLEKFEEQYNQMHKEGYRLIGLEVNDEIVAVAGINILTNFYNNKFLFVYDLVTKETERSKGYGEELMTYIHRYAREQECSHVTLESALHRVDAHRFYEEKMGYDKFCYSFRYTL
ncbi:GNAT family N-acetyltransferase [Gottfriedia sp. S16(2024)]|uniref:GNAT family N-acetyltransferase n=1 Tax=Gottfriedia sp. S16(2024) TaxID=3162883 RepID=UPI003D20A409